MSNICGACNHFISLKCKNKAIFYVFIYNDINFSPWVKQYSGLNENSAYSLCSEHYRVININHFNSFKCITKEKYIKYKILK